MKDINRISKTQVELATDKINFHKRKINAARLIKEDKLKKGNFDNEYYRADIIMQVNEKDEAYWRGFLHASKTILSHTDWSINKSVLPEESLDI